MGKFKRIGKISIVILVIVIGVIFVIKNKNKEYNSSNTELAFYYTDNGNQIKTDKIPDGYVLDTYSSSDHKYYEEYTTTTISTAFGGETCY